jgi:mono/diheme cytochrome c family protein
MARITPLRAAARSFHRSNLDHTGSPIRFTEGPLLHCRKSGNRTAGITFCGQFRLAAPLLDRPSFGGVRMKRAGKILILAAVIFVPSLAPALAQKGDKVAQGAALFSSQKCTMCHSAAGKGNPKGSLDGLAATHKADEIRQWILDPEGMRAKTNATRTPAMKQMKLAGDQVDALVAFITSLKSTPKSVSASDAAK